jgi:hypothetical protein
MIRACDDRATIFVLKRPKVRVPLFTGEQFGGEVANH